MSAGSRRFGEGRPTPPPEEEEPLGRLRQLGLERLGWLERLERLSQLGLERLGWLGWLERLERLSQLGLERLGWLERLERLSQLGLERLERLGPAHCVRSPSDLPNQGEDQAPILVLLPGSGGNPVGNLDCRRSS